jgi:hypothetical protein
MTCVSQALRIIKAGFRSKEPLTDAVAFAVARLVDEATADKCARSSHENGSSIQPNSFRLRRGGVTSDHPGTRSPNESYKHVARKNE